MIKGIEKLTEQQRDLMEKTIPSCRGKDRESKGILY